MLAVEPLLATGYFPRPLDHADAAAEGSKTSAPRAALIAAQDSPSADDTVVTTTSASVPLPLRHTIQL
jgi:hypothetical protein